jgi:hypothetical protein
VLFSILLINNPTGAQRSIFYIGLDDFFADFFNVLRYISERDPYHNTINGYEQKIYFPLSYLILYPFSQLDDFNSMSLNQTWGSKIGIMSVFVFTLISIFLLFLALNKMRKKYHLPPQIYIGLFLTYIFFFSIERGNTIILSAAFICFFICYYDSDNKNERMFASITLALAVTLKIYPVLFGFLYLEKRQYKEIFSSVVFTLLLVFLPFLFFKRGFSNIPQLINNWKAMTGAYSYKAVFPRFSLAHILYFGMAFLGQPERILLLFSNIAYILIYLASFISIILSLLIKDKLTKIFLLTNVILFLPENSAIYCGLYLFPAIMLFFATIKERSTFFNIFVLSVFIVLLNPFQFVITYKELNIPINYIFGNIALLALWLVLLIVSIKQVIAQKIMPQLVRK